MLASLRPSSKALGFKPCLHPTRSPTQNAAKVQKASVELPEIERCEDLRAVRGGRKIGRDRLRRITRSRHLLPLLPGAASPWHPAHCKGWLLCLMPSPLLTPSPRPGMSGTTRSTVPG